MVRERRGGAPRFSDSHLRIDIVEEDSSVRRALGRLLSCVGLRSSGYASAQAYLETGDSASAACLLLDLHAPGLSGIELVEHLSETTPSLPVISMVHLDEPDAQRWLSSLGVVECLRKPFDQTELFQAISNVTTFSLP